MLNTLTHGHVAEGVPLLVAHGLFGSARNWGVIAKRLSARRPVAAVDMRNHGQSPWFDRHGYLDMADDLARAAGDGPVDVLGHSMGGKAAMVLALNRPELVRKLVVADIAPVGYAHTQMPMIDAMRTVDLAAMAARSDADKQLAEHIAEPAVRAFLLQSLDVPSRSWRLNLDVLAAEMDEIIGFPDIGSRFEGPTLFLAGGESDYVTPDARPRIKALFPNAMFAKIPGAGHWLHADRPREFEAAVDVFLSA